MKRVHHALIACALLLAAGCSGKSQDNSASNPPAPTTGTAAAESAATPAAPAAAPAQLATRSQYDDGPRADAGPVDAAQAAAGEKLFNTKGCTACHGYGRKLTGPDLKGVTRRRTAAWMEQQILHPEVMTRTDPIAHGLMLANNNLQMLNLHLTPAEARSLIAYFKKLDAAK